MAYVRTVTRSMDGATIETDRRKRLARAIWSSDEVDAHRTSFVMGGIDTTRFAQNPVILYEHGQSTERGRLPVANAVEYGPDRFKGRNVFIGTSRFWEGDEFAERLFDRYASGQMRGWSINAQPLDASPPTRQERQARPDWAESEMVFRSVRLLEVSATSLPSNPSTLTLSVERSLAAGLAPIESRIALYRRWSRDPWRWGRLAVELGRLEADQRRGVRDDGHLPLIAELERLLGKRSRSGGRS